MNPTRGKEGPTEKEAETNAEMEIGIRTEPKLQTEMETKLDTGMGRETRGRCRWGWRQE